MRATAENPPSPGTPLGPWHESDTPDLRLRSNYRADIDGLRALAIIPVVIFHAFPTIMPGGFIGVDIFFVISGFLISSIILQALLRGSFSFSGFYSNRIKRIFPALLVMLAACFAFGWLFLFPEEYMQLGKHMVGAVGYIENIVLRREAAGYFDNRSTLKPLMHLWSLGIEEQFYLTYPLFLWLVWRVRRNLFLILWSLAVVSFGLNLWQVQGDAVGAFFLPQTRWWELMIGGAIACRQLFGESASRPAGSRPLQTSAVSNTLAAVGVLLIALGVFWIHESDSFPGWRALLPVGGAALLMQAGPLAWINRRILGSKPMVFVGLISYPLYLWHWPVLTFPRMVRGTELSVATRGTGVLLSFVLAWATWRFIESPIRFGRKIWIKTAALVVISVVIGAAGFTAYHREGFIGRFPMLEADLGQVQRGPWSTRECREMLGLADINYCLISGAGPPDVVLIGDSHAGALYDGLAPTYRERAQTLMNLGQAGCAPFYGTDSFSPGVRHEDCRPVVNRILEFAASSASVHTIIFAFRGPRYLSGQGFGAAEEGAAPKRILWEGAEKNATQAEIFAAAFRNTMSRLHATGKNVILFLNWPELGFDPMSCLPRPVRLFTSPRQFCGVPRIQGDARNRAYREVVFGLGKDLPGVKVFDPLPYFCDSSECYAMKAGHLLYSDDNHLSEAGARYLGEKFFEEQSPVQSSSGPLSVVHSAKPH